MSLTKVSDIIDSQKSYLFRVLDLGTGSVIERRLLTHWEVSEINNNLKQQDKNIRYILAENQY
jgi:hypothetical protein